MKDENGKPIEQSPVEMWRRVARGIAEAEPPEKREVWQQKFEEILQDFKFVPGGRILAGAGTGAAVTYYNCYVIPSPEDSRKGILDNVALMVEIMSRGGGVGVNLSTLRPRGSYVKGVNGTSSGPVSWAEVYSTATGSVIQGGCFGPDQRIATDRGLIPAKELAERVKSGERIYALTHEGPRLITYAFRNGVKPLFRVTTARGFTVDVTQEHKMGVLRNGRVDTIPLEELAEGDETLLLLADGIEADYVALQEVPYRRSKMSTRLNEEITFPSVLDERLAYFLGYLHGDGYIHWGKKVNWRAPKAIKLATADAYPEIRERLVEIVRSLFGLEPVVEAGDGKCKNIAIYSRMLLEWLKHNGLFKRHSDAVRVPEAIFRSPSPVMGAFVAGYFDADGSDRGRKAGYGFDSVSLDMLRDVQQLLIANGILSRISSTDRSREGWRTIHRLVVTGAEFKQRMSRFMAMAVKNKRIAGKRNHGNHDPRELWRQLGVPGKYYQGLWDSTKPRISYRALSRIKNRLEADGQTALATRVAQVLRYIPDTITRIEPIGLTEVYDFEVDDVHMLSGNGFYTSNSRRGALMLMLDDDHPDIEEFINVKRDLTKITNANLSVCVSDAFMEAVKHDRPWELKWGGKVYRTLRARELWDQICEAAWASGEPGVVFMERYQKQSNTWYCEEIRCVNPCFVGSTRIATERGLVTLKELYESQEALKVLTDNRALDEALQVVGLGRRHTTLGVTLRQATPVFKTGENVPVYRLVTEHGYEVTATHDHRFLTPAGYVEMKDLEPGDVLYLQSGEGAWPQDDRLPDIAWSPQARARLEARQRRGACRVPERWSREIGQVLGWAVADGYVYRRGKNLRAVLYFGQEETALFEQFRERLAGWFGLKGTVSRRYNTTALHHEAVVATFLQSLGVTEKDAVEKRVPDAIWRAPREAVIGFLQGLFTAHGTVNRHDPTVNCSVRLASSSRGLLQDVQLLLLNLGIVSALRLRRKRMIKEMPDQRGGTAAYETAPQYELIISRSNMARFADIVGFLTDVKQRKLEGFLSNRTHGVRQERFVTKVKEIVFAGREDVYDLTESVTNSLIANGFSAHNCGEQGLGPYGVCNLGAINLVPFVKDGKFDWDGLAETAAVATRFLDDVIDVNYYFLKENEKAQKEGIRRIGLGTMGLADALILLKMRYGSQEAVEFTERVFRTMRDAAYRTSAELAKEKGPFPLFDKEKYLQGYFIKRLPEDIRAMIAEYGIRNGVLLTQAPTGTTSLVAGVSSGIEPVFSFSFQRKDRTGTHVIYHPLYQAWKEAHPDEPVPEYFVSADQLTPEEHVRMQAAAQKYVDSSISKTVNAPNSHTVDEVKKLYTLAYELGCKGVTYFRDGSRDAVLTRLDDDKPKQAETKQKQTGPAVNGTWGSIKPIPRPARLTGLTMRKPTPLGNLYVTLNTIDGKPFEMFAQIGKAGSDVAAFTEAIARLASLAFRCGVDPREVEKQLAVIGGSQALGFGANRVRSVPDAIAQVLSEYLDGIAEEDPDVLKAKGQTSVFDAAQEEDGGPHTASQADAGVASTIADGNGNGLATSFDTSEAPLRLSFNLCPECGSQAYVYQEGCAKCMVCGHSEC